MNQAKNIYTIKNSQRRTQGIVCQNGLWYTHPSWNNVYSALTVYIVYIYTFLTSLQTFAFELRESKSKMNAARVPVSRFMFIMLVCMRSLFFCVSVPHFLCVLRKKVVCAFSLWLHDMLTCTAHAKRVFKIECTMSANELRLVNRRLRELFY